MSNQEVYEKITERMVKALEAGTVPWIKPWSAATGGRPRSISTGDPYHGINQLLLGVEAQDKGYASPYWGTYNAIAERSGMERRTSSRNGHQYWASPDGTPRGVRKGETGTPIVLWKQGTVKEADPDTGERAERQVLLARMYYVFNADQAEQLPDRYYPARTGEQADGVREPQEVLDGYLASGGPELRHVEGDRAYYQSRLDRITMPERSQFKSAEAYYGAAFHEVGHSTGHPGRLNREGIAEFDHFGSERYGREELVAQMTSAMLQAETGIETPAEFERSAAYLQNWLTAIKGDTKLVPQAAAQAQRAVDLITEPQRQAEREDQAELDREAA
jgi:antirestriction protein ArdC